MKTNKVSTLRANKFSVINCSGNICLVSSPVPFKYGDKVIDQKVSNGTYQIELRGHVNKEFYKEFSK